MEGLDEKKMQAALSEGWLCEAHCEFEATLHGPTWTKFGEPNSPTKLALGHCGTGCGILMLAWTIVWPWLN